MCRHRQDGPSSAQRADPPPGHWPAGMRELHFRIMLVYIVRHAEPDYSIDSLTPAGHSEAQALAGRMGKIGLTHLYASGLPVSRSGIKANWE